MYFVVQVGRPNPVQLCKYDNFERHTIVRSLIDVTLAVIGIFYYQIKQINQYFRYNLIIPPFLFLFVYSMLVDYRKLGRYHLLITLVAVVFP